MSRLPAYLCLACLLALAAAACTSKSEPPAQPAATDDAATRPADGVRGGGDAMRDRGDDLRARGDRMREAAGVGQPEAAPQAPAAPAPPAPTAAQPEARATGAESDVREDRPSDAPPAGQPVARVAPGSDTLRGRADTLRSRAARMRSRAGGSVAGEDVPSESAAPARSGGRTSSPAAGSTMPRGAVASPVDPDDLAGLLPAMSAPWAKGRTEANTLTSPVVLSQARVTYRQGSAYVRIEIVDGAGNEAAIAYLTANRPRGSRRVGGEGYERSATFAGHPSWETWQPAQQHGSLNVLVGGRFLVSYTGHGIPSADILTDLGRRTDLRALERLR